MAWGTPFSFLLSQVVGTLEYLLGFITAVTLELAAPPILASRANPLLLLAIQLSLRNIFSNPGDDEASDASWTSSVPADCLGPRSIAVLGCVSFAAEECEKGLKIERLGILNPFTALQSDRLS